MNFGEEMCFLAETVARKKRLAIKRKQDQKDQQYEEKVKPFWKSLKAIIKKAASEGRLWLSHAEDIRLPENFLQDPELYSALTRLAKIEGVRIEKATKLYTGTTISLQWGQE